MRVQHIVFDNNINGKHINDLKKNIDNYNLKLFIINFDKSFERIKGTDINKIQLYIKNKQNILFFNKNKINKILYLIFIFLLINLIMSFFKKSFNKYSLRSNVEKNFSEDHDSLTLYLFGLFIIFICILYEIIKYFNYHYKKIILEKMKLYIQT
jgi:hypothetical protein